MTYKENITAILECHFTGFKQEIIDNAVNCISALSENKGEWIIDDMDSGILTRIWACHCSICGKDPQADISGTENWWLDKLPNFCPNCGADMREPKDIIHKAIDNTTFAEEAYPNIKEELHKAVDMAEPKGEKEPE